MHVGRRVRLFRPILVVAAVLLAASCATANEPDGAASPGDEPTAPTQTSAPEPASTSLTITLDETGEGSDQTFTLTCDPAGGDHPDPAAACAALAAAGGAEAMAPPSSDETCTEIYGGPAVATVQGTVDGVSVSATFGRSNGCEISRWDALAPLLGSTGGGL